MKIYKILVIHIHTRKQYSKIQRNITYIHGKDGKPKHKHKNKMKSTKVQTLGAVTLHATTACTDDANIKSTQVVCVRTRVHIL